MKILHGDCLDRLKELPDNSVDSCVTDPPYGLSKEPKIDEVLTKWLNGEPYDHGHGGFMGKAWDSFVPHPDIWSEVFRVLKPGGHALVFAGTRTQDLMTISLRLAGFEVRDVIEWLYFSGFPKSHDVSKAFDRRAGAEREKVGEYTISGTVDIQGGNYNSGKTSTKTLDITAPATELARKWDGWGTALKPAHEPIIVVRKPLVDADTCRKLTVADCVEKYGTGAINIDATRIAFEEGTSTDSATRAGRGAGYEAHNMPGRKYGDGLGGIVAPPHEAGRFPANAITTDADAFYSKYFNVSPPELSKKSSKKDRNSDWRGVEVGKNVHPTVKPTDLMAWLVRLVTPADGVVLDPFAGSGSTLVAAKREGFRFIGVELTDEYIPIIEARTGEVAR